MDTLLFLLHAVSVAVMCYLFLVDDKRGRNQPFTSLFRYKTDLLAPRRQAGQRDLRGDPARLDSRVRR